MYRKILVFLLCVSFFLPEDVHAQLMPGTSCDVGMWDRLTERSSLIGQQEMEVAQNLILKPDSVLEYSCFVYLASMMQGNVADDTASRSIRWGIDRPSIDFVDDNGNPYDFWRPFATTWLSGPIEMYGVSADPIDNMIQEPLLAYLDNNYGQFFGGGRMDNAWTDSLGRPIQPCAAMAAVWDQVHCDNNESDMFFQLTALPGTDVRQFPAACDPVLYTTDRAADTQAALDIAFPAAGPVATFVDVVDVADCSTQIPVPTGLTVERNGNTFEDKFCVAPGCTYEPGANAGDLGTCVAVP